MEINLKLERGFWHNIGQIFICWSFLSTEACSPELTTIRFLFPFLNRFLKAFFGIMMLRVTRDIRTVCFDLIRLTTINPPKMSSDFYYNVLFSLKQEPSVQVCFRKLILILEFLSNRARDVCASASVCVCVYLSHFL